MRLVLLIFVFVCFSSCSVAQVVDSCNQKTIVPSYKKKLEPNFCIPKGYIIARIYEQDLNSDNLIDKVVRWYREERVNGDTTFYSFYFQKVDKSYQLFDVYSNLTSLYFNNEVQDREITLSDSLLNEVKNNYMYYDDMPEFYRNDIIIAFYVDASTQKKLFFTYSKSRNIFYLYKQEEWLAPVTDQYTRELLDESIYAEQEGIPLADFDMLEYLE